MLKPLDSNGIFDKTPPKFYEGTNVLKLDGRKTMQIFNQVLLFISLFNFILLCYHVIHSYLLFTDIFITGVLFIL